TGIPLSASHIDWGGISRILTAVMAAGWKLSWIPGRGRGRPGRGGMMARASKGRPGGGPLAVALRVWMTPVLLVAILACASSVQGEESVSGVALEQSACWSDRVLRLADPPPEGHDVWELQARLAELGYYDGPVDSRFSAQLEEAVRRFQGDRQLPADGVVGPRTWEALDRKSTRLNSSHVKSSYAVSCLKK